MDAVGLVQCRISGDPGEKKRDEMTRSSCRKPRARSAKGLARRRNGRTGGATVSRSKPKILRGSASDCLSRVLVTPAPLAAGGDQTLDPRAARFVYDAVEKATPRSVGTTIPARSASSVMMAMWWIVWLDRNISSRSTLLSTVLE